MPRGHGTKALDDVDHGKADAHEPSPIPRSADKYEPGRPRREREAWTTDANGGVQRNRVSKPARNPREVYAMLTVGCLAPRWGLIRGRGCWMGRFRELKETKQMVAAAPGLVQQAQEWQAAHQQWAGGMGTGTSMPSSVGLTEADLTPIAGVTLDVYAAVSRELAEVSYDLTQAPALAAGRGIPAGDWQAAVVGWNQRMLATPALAQQFALLYTGR
jgi:hypothetical protein